MGVGVCGLALKGLVIRHLGIKAHRGSSFRARNRKKFRIQRWESSLDIQGVGFRAWGGDLRLVLLAFQIRVP